MISRVTGHSNRMEGWVRKQPRKQRLCQEESTRLESPAHWSKYFMWTRACALQVHVNTYGAEVPQGAELEPF